ncbi:hypothetical protein, partial [Brachymonas denitrificans]|uniref:hypothetical protein n=1 Tax=Brachymonas denitrificans TaxID=28220 RepID=UPI001F30C43E
RQTTGGNLPTATPWQRCPLKPTSLLETRGGSPAAEAFRYYMLEHAESYLAQHFGGDAHPQLSGI